MSKEYTMFWWVGMLCVLFGVIIGFCGTITKEDRYIPAEVLAQTDTTTVFVSPDGDLYTAQRAPENCPNDTQYLLNVDGKEVLVVWKVVD